MISIKRFLEQYRKVPAPDLDVREALTQMVRLLLDAMATHMVRGKEADFRSLRNTLSGLDRQMAGPQSAMSLLGISSDAVEALETYCQRTRDYLRELHEERQSIVAMLTDTVAQLAGQTDSSVARLQAIEKQVERASGLDDIRALRASLGESLQALREAAAHHRDSSASTVARLQGQIDMARKLPPGQSRSLVANSAYDDLIPEAPDGPVESPPTSYVAAFQLQRANFIAKRFGETVEHQMLSMIGKQLKTVLGPNDRLMRWKRASFVMFINSTATIPEINARLFDTVAATGQQYVEVGSRSALLSIGVDWIVFPQSGRPSLDVVFREVDAFLAKAGPAASRVTARR
jgi:GGDEF domain-containing protein